MTTRAERRRESRAGARRESSSSRLPWVIGGVVVLGLIVVGWNLVSSILDPTVRAPVPVEYSSPQELVQLAQGVESGNPDATVTIVEFADFQCPNCRDFFLLAKPFLDLAYIQPGNVRFVLFDWPIVDVHPNAFLAARAARCAGDQGAYWEFHDRLFQSQNEWAFLADPSRTFEELAAGLSLSRETFSGCLASDRHADVVTANMMLGSQMGVQGTPTVLIDTGQGREIQISDWSIDSLRAVLDPAISAGAAGPDGTTTPEAAEPEEAGQ